MSARLSGTSPLTSRDLAHIAVFAALIIALGLPGTINIGGSAVPITMQSLGVILAGALLGPRKGVLAVLTVIVLGLALPVLAGGRTSLTSLSGATAGFLIGWIPTVAVIGWLTVKMLPNYSVIKGTLINVLGGVVVLYLCGTVGMLLRGLSFGTAMSSNLTYLPGDLIKAVLAAVVAAQVHRAYPMLLTDRAARRTPAAEPDAAA